MNASARIQLPRRERSTLEDRQVRFAEVLREFRAYPDIGGRDRLAEHFAACWRARNGSLVGAERWIDRLDRWANRMIKERERLEGGA